MERERERGGIPHGLLPVLLGLMLSNAEYCLLILLTALTLARTEFFNRRERANGSRWRR